MVQYTTINLRTVMISDVISFCGLWFFLVVVNTISFLKMGVKDEWHTDDEENHKEYMIVNPGRSGGDEIIDVSSAPTQVKKNFNRMMTRI